MIERKGLVPRVVAWGNPWHGRFTGAGLQLPNGSVLAASVPANTPETCLVRFTGIAETETPPDLAAAGGEWLVDAVLYTSSKRYSPTSDKGIGYLGWLWRDANGQVWRIRASFSNSVSNPAVGSSSTMSITVYARKFGVFGQGSLPEYTVLSTTRSWTNRGPSRQVVLPHLAHSPTGARTAFTLRTGPVSYTSAPAAGDMTARTAFVRAPLASMLLELVITGLNGLGRPAVTLNTVVDSTAALATSSSSTPAGNIGATSIDRPTAGSTTGSTLVTGYETYRAITGAASNSTVTTNQQLMCGVYQEETLVPVWHRREVAATSLYEASPSIEGRFDWQYTKPAGSTGWGSATSALRETTPFTYNSVRGWDTTTRDSILLGGSEFLTHERRVRDRTEYNFVMPAVSNTALPDSDDWFNGRLSFMTSSEVATYQEWINGVLVSSGVPLVEHDALRASWNSAEPAILSNNVFALCPVGSQRYVERLLSQAGSTLDVDPPAAIGAYGELACPSFNPRTGEMSLVVDGVNGYI